MRDATGRLSIGFSRILILLKISFGRKHPDVLCSNVLGCPKGQKKREIQNNPRCVNSQGHAWRNEKTMRLKLLKPLLCLVVILGLASNVAIAQQTVTGKVISVGDNEVLPGVTVLIKGTTKGSVTDIEGNYRIEASPDDIIVFSFIGYVTQEVKVGSQAVIDVDLEFDVQSLDEVVVVGYGEQKKANLTGAISVVETKELEDIPVSNLSESLVGRLAGVEVSRGGNGIPGAQSALVIRRESASGNIARQVLYVIDGVVYTEEQDGTGPSGHEMFNRLDPTEIESISILKDAAAAVYGARGSGGVILVKTKRGKAGKIRINYNGSLGIGTPTQTPDMMSAGDHARMLNDILDVKALVGERVRPSDYISEDEINRVDTLDYDWLDGLYKDAVTQRHSINVSGGGENVRYFFSGGYYHETGNYSNIWYKRYNLRSNVEADLSDDLMFTLGMSFNEGRRKNPDLDGTSGSGLAEFFRRPFTAPKWAPPVVDGLPTAHDDEWNPYAFFESGSTKESVSNNMNITGSLDYEVPVITGLKLSTMFAYNVNNATGNSFRQNFYTNPLLVESGEKLPRPEIDYDQGQKFQNNDERIRNSFTKGINYQFNFSANYSRTFGDHNLGATFVYEQSDGNSEEINVTLQNAEIGGYNYLWAFSRDGMDVGSGYKQLGRWGSIGRVNYDYKGRYLIESSFRYEASSKFAASDREGFFPAVSAGWVISEESFFSDNIGFMNFFKIRSSYGITGNDNTRPYEHRASYLANRTGPVFGDGSEGTLSGAIEIRNKGVTVPTRTWAKTRNFNVGVDLKAVNHKLSLTAEYYYAETYDGFMRNPTYPFVIGNAKPPEENYKISFSEGYEIQLGFKDKIGNDFSYSFNANFTRRRSRPLKLYQNPAAIGSYYDELINDDSNQPGYTAIGIIRTEEDLAMVREMFYNMDPEVWQLGMIAYQDIGGDVYSNEPDGLLTKDGDTRIIAEYTSPPYSYGLSFRFGWKEISVSGNFSGVFGHKEFIPKVEHDHASLPDLNSNTFAWWGDYWTEDNPDASLPRPYAYGLEDQHSTFWMRDGHTLRLNNLNVSYAIPDKWSRKIKVDNWRFYMTVTNVWTIISPFDYKDPAISNAFEYPLVRTISLGTRFSL